MTAARQKRKSLGVIASALLAAAIVLGAPPVRSATTEHIVADHHTGLAISGYDPVAYFADASAVVGRAGLELRFAGVTWRFRNEGNRAAFAANPEIYLPRFGGYDPIAVGRGASAPGHPEVWLVRDERLYLFYNAGARTAFTADPEHAIAAAERNWAQVQSTLVP